jgi:hypothetical protein
MRALPLLTVKTEFVNSHPDLIPDTNAEIFLSNDGEKTQRASDAKLNPSRRPYI